MKPISIRRQLPLPSRSELESFERSAGIALPADYKDFLLRYNPIDLKESVFVTASDKYYIDVFYPISYTYGLSLQIVSQNLNPYFQKEYIAFANDAGGWQFVCGLNEGDRGKVYFCRMDKVVPYSLTFLASNFTEFLNKLQVS